MSRVHVIVEGPSEESFVNEVLSPELSRRGVYLYPQLIGRPGHKGGIRPYSSAKRDILISLKQDRHAFCTTMFDYYGMPDTWPGVSEVKGKPFHLISSTIESSIYKDIGAAMGDAYNASQFMPYVQMHEFEALLFSDIAKLRYCYPGEDAAITALVGQAAKFESPEMINDSRDTAPSKRIEKEIKDYQKVIAGSVTALEISLPVLRSKCQHFNEWVTKLEALGTG